MKETIGSVVEKIVPKEGVRWTFGEIIVEDEKGKRHVFTLLGVVIQWLRIGDRVKAKIMDDGSYSLYKLYSDGEVQIWPLFRKEFSNPRYSPVTGDVLYEYHVVAREAFSEADYLAIVELEQYHYASKKELVAIWRCRDGRIIEANVQPSCNGEQAELVAIKGSLPASRFLVLELKDREAYEPAIIGYVRVDPPVPLMHRRVERDREVFIDRHIRLKVFPRAWIYPTFWPERLMKKLKEEYDSLSKKYGKRKAHYILSEKVKEEALETCNTAAARIARVVIHPDYRGDGFGVLAVKAAIEWIKDRRIPEMRKKKHVVEVIAQMARYHPFFEKVGFKYLWDTAGGKPVLYYPLTREAEERIKDFLRRDEYARRHGGILYKPRFKTSEKLKGPIILEKVSKLYSSTLDIEGLHPKVQEVLKAFGVIRRTVQRYVLKDVSLRIDPGSIVVVIGLSGAGKTTLLRMIIGAASNITHPRYVPNLGKIMVPENVKLSVLLPGEIEPVFEDESLLEHMFRKLGDEVAAIEVLNISGLSDAVFYRAHFNELSTGQKERAKIASLLAERPNLLVIDEFTAHLDALTAQRVARKLSKIAREQNITLLLATNRAEVIKVLEPDLILYVGYGGVTYMPMLTKNVIRP